MKLQMKHVMTKSNFQEKKFRLWLISMAAIFCILFFTVPNPLLYFAIDVVDAYKFKTRLKKQLQSKEIVYVSNLVDFEWKRIYVINAYSFSDFENQEKKQNRQVRLDYILWLWDANEDYWTVAFIKQDGRVLLIRMSAYYVCTQGGTGRFFSDKKNAFFQKLFIYQFSDCPIRISLNEEQG